MAVTTLPGLIDKQDSFEIVRNQVFELLRDNAAAQVALATTAGKTDPQEWNLRVYQERFNPWERFQNAPDDVVPIVNVWFDSGIFPKDKGDPIKQQLHDA